MVTRPPVYLLGALVLSSGCYTYAQTTLEAAPVGSETRALLSTEGQLTLFNQIGVDTRSIQGKLQSKDGDRVGFTVPALFSLTQVGSGVHYQQFELPRRDVLRLEVREFDGLKTGGLVGGLTGLVVFAIVALSGDSQGGSQSGPLPPEPVR